MRGAGHLFGAGFERPHAQLDHVLLARLELQDVEAGIEFPAAGGFLKGMLSRPLPNGGLAALYCQVGASGKTRSAVFGMVNS